MNKKGTAFPLLLIAVIIVALVSLLPLNSSSNGLLKDFSLWGDLFPAEEVAQIGGVTYIDPDLEGIINGTEQVVDKDSVMNPMKSGKSFAESSDSVTTVEETVEKPLPSRPARKEGEPVKIEIFSEQGMSRFKNAMAKRDTRPVRIAIIGDSYIEGDIFSQNIRERLQEQYGGNGVGYVPLSSELTGFRQSIRQSCSGWEKHDFRNSGKKYSTLAGVYHTPESYASTTVKGSKKMSRSATWNNSKFLFIAPSATSVTLTDSSGESSTYEIEPSEDVQSIEIDGETSELKLTTPVSPLIALGLYLNDSNGVTVDNMSIRGYSGIKHADISVELASKMRKFIDYDLIIVEYGINALTSDNTNYGYYTKAMEKAITRIKEAYPNSDILVMGIGDRGEKVGSTVRSMKSVPYMVEQQREMAHKLGVSFWDTREAMGGEDAVVEWVKNKDVNKDYIHLSFTGGDRLAALFVESLNQYLND